MSLPKIWLMAIVFLAVLWRLFVSGRIINWIGFFQALPGIIADLACQLRIDISGLFKRRKNIALDESEEFYHNDLS